jgi:hypothetical protein
MTLRTVAVIGWICFALDALFVVGLLASKNMGDDAAGRGLATAWGAVLAVPLLIAGALLLWGTRGGSRGFTIAGALLAALPFLVMVGNTGKGLLNQAGRRAWIAREGRYDDPKLTALAQAAKRGDADAVKSLLASSRPNDFAMRDAGGLTALGVAVKYGLSPYATPGQRAALVAMLQGGVPYAPDAVREGGDWFAEQANNSGDTVNEVLEVALKAGANPNAKEPFEEHALILSHNMTVAKVELLARHGADLQARSARTDRPGWSTLMNAVYQQQWPEALFFLRHGVSPDYRAPDGKTVRDVLGEITAASWASVDTTDARYRELRDALGMRLGARLGARR